MSTHRRLRLSLLAAIATVLTYSAPAAQAAGTATLSGTFFFDLDRDGVQDAGEAAMPDQRVCLLDATGANLIASATTDAAGRYRFSGLDDGVYRVAQAASDWWALRHDWVPTTTGSIFPRVAVDLAGDAVADFGWRRIVRSTDLAAPITTYGRSDGLRVDSYDDVVDAREIYDTLMQGQLVGVEAATVRVLFDFGDTSVASWGVSGGPGSYENYRATVQVDYVSWLHSGDKTLFHEYGHAWSMYYAHMMQQSTALTSYLSLRGILDDPRLGSSHAWSRYELIAEDYRQLFGTSNARSTPQENQELPAAGDVPGLRDFLAGPYMQSPTPTPAPAPAPAPTPVPTPSPALAVSSLAMNPTTVKTGGTASFALSAGASVSVSIRDARGNLVRSLLSGPASAGAVTTAWDRRNAAGQRVKGGTYRVVVDARGSSGEHAAASADFSVA